MSPNAVNGEDGPIECGSSGSDRVSGRCSMRTPSSSAGCPVPFEPTADRSPIRAVAPADGWSACRAAADGSCRTACFLSPASGPSGRLAGPDLGGG